jgi:hypothetical protein
MNPSRCAFRAPASPNAEMADLLARPSRNTEEVLDDLVETHEAVFGPRARG